VLHSRHSEIGTQELFFVFLAACNSITLSNCPKKRSLPAALNGLTDLSAVHLCARLYLSSLFMKTVFLFRSHVATWLKVAWQRQNKRRA